ncbi:MAG: FhaA domain-containing protein [Ancrocorticia sp.]|uniref:FhaA domain-containing protein n=1 Tax=Ancrocorticia sp. TaxID=2593684 RepID=UPI003F8E2FF3
MGAFDKLEKGMGNAVANAFSRFRSELKPIEIASALKKALDEHAATMSRERTVSPNYFKISLSPADHESVVEWGEDALIEEFTQTVTDYATEQDYAFLGPIRMKFTKNPELKVGTVKVEASTRRGAVAPATSNAASAEHPIIEIGIKRYLLTGAVTVIGRGSDCDITVDDTGASRHHLELRVTAQGVIATDLGSTNGTFVEGHKINAATLVDGNTLTIGRTHIMFWNTPESA